MSAGDRRERMQAMPRELELRVEQARRHEQRMREVLAESDISTDSADREWIAHAATEATADRERAEQSLGAARLLMSEAFPGLHLEAARNVIARCRCGATWVVPVRAVRRTLPRTYAHTPGALICSVCGNTAALDDAAAPDPDQPAKGVRAVTSHDQRARPRAQRAAMPASCAWAAPAEPDAEGTRP